MGHQLTEKGLGEAMAEMDTDMDGVIDFDEFIGWWSVSGGEESLARFPSVLETHRSILSAYARVLSQPVKIIVGFAQVRARCSCFVENNALAHSVAARKLL